MVGYVADTGLSSSSFNTNSHVIQSATQREGELNLLLEQKNTIIAQLDTMLEVSDAIVVCVSIMFLHTSSLGYVPVYKLLVPVLVPIPRYEGISC